MYDIKAIIGDAEMLQANCPSVAKIISLPQGKAMIPLTDRLFEGDEIPFLPFTYGGERTLPELFAEFLSPFVGQGKFVYVEACISGDLGTQACVTWDDKGNSSVPLVDTNAINTALRFLDVQIGGHRDEFEALGLGKFRSTEDWENDVTTQSS